MIKTRFAPSPTGFVHLGSIRTALYSYLYAKQQGGHYILRIEDTDQSRFVEGAIENLINEMNWAGIYHDEGPVLSEHGLEEVGDSMPYLQSKRLGLYREAAERLVKEDKAYPCFCSKERLESLKEQGHFGYDQHCRNLDKETVKKRLEAGEDHVIRLKMPLDQEMTLDDLVRGAITFNSKDSDDQVLIKADGWPTYHLAVVVDDHHMGITHALRGEEWISSTPKQMVLYDYLGWQAPRFGHLPTIMNKETGRKLSKRDGDVYVEDFRKKGYLPEALVNFLALIGWNPGDEREIMDLQEMTEAFSFDRVSKSSGVFDYDKLNFMNNHYIREAEDTRLYNLMKDYLVPQHLEESQYHQEHFMALIALLKEKADTLEELKELILPFLQDEMAFEEDAREIIKAEHVPALFKRFKEEIKEVSWTEEDLKALIKTLGKELGIKGKDLFMPVRIGVSGNCHGSDLIKTIHLLGRDRVLERLETSLKEIE